VTGKFICALCYARKNHKKIARQKRLRLKNNPKQREKINKTVIESYWADPETARKKSRIWKKKNQSKVKKWSKRYWRKNRVGINKKHRWQYKNDPAFRKKRQKWEDDHREEKNKKTKENYWKHLRKERKRNREKYHKNKEVINRKIRSRLRNNPTYLEKKRKYSREHRKQKYHSDKKYATKVKKNAREINRKNKLEVLSKYSIKKYPICECCGEKEINFLTIGHPKKRRGKEKKVGGTGLYRYLITRNFPPGRKVQCFNCNCSSGFRGPSCAHKRPFKFPNSQPGKRTMKCFEAYKSGKKIMCVCCGEEELGFLSLGHGTNTKERERKLGITYREGEDLKSKLITLGFPKLGYKIECFNCNCGKEANGIICPHKLN